MLPPVNNSNKNNKVNSAPCKYPQQDQHFSPDEVGGGGGKASKRQSGQQGNRQASAASPKQYKTKAIQNFTFNHPGNCVCDLQVQQMLNVAKPKIINNSIVINILFDNNFSVLVHKHITICFGQSRYSFQKNSFYQTN